MQNHIKTFVLISLLGCQSVPVNNKSAEVYAPHKIQVQGHRGARGVLPENSLPAFDYALKVGVDVLELDMGVTRDHVIVVSHEPYVSPELCLDKTGAKIKEPIPYARLSLQEVKTYQCGLLPHPKFSKQQKLKTQIPTLREVFELVKNSTYPAAAKVKFNIETKIVPGMPELTPSPEEFAKLVLDLVKEYGLLDRVILQSFDHRTLVAARKLEPKITLSPLVEDTLLNLPLMATDLHAEIVSPNHMWITRTDVDSLHRSGVQVIPWTVNEPKDWERMLALGVDGIITDYPEDLIKFLNTKGLR